MQTDIVLGLNFGCAKKYRPNFEIFFEVSVAVSPVLDSIFIGFLRLDTDFCGFSRVFEHIRENLAIRRLFIGRKVGILGKLGESSLKYMNGFE